MNTEKAHIIAQLKKEILSLGGLRSPLQDIGVPEGLTFMQSHFPHGKFPKSAIHEFLCGRPEDIAVTNGFISAVVTSIFPSAGTIIWVSETLNNFPPYLKFFNIEPDQIIFIRPSGTKECLWVIEEALKCNGLKVVIAETRELKFVDSRRFQLAVEQSNVTGFLLNLKPGIVHTTATVSRWQINTLPSEVVDNLPGIGFPRWNVELQKIRNGTKGNWQIEWNGTKLNEVSKRGLLQQAEQQKKAG